MKTYFRRAVIHGLSLAGWLVAAGCGAQNNAVRPAAQTENPAPKPAVAAKAPPTLAEKIEARFKDVDMEALNLSPGVTDIIRLMRSGVTEQVVLSYIAGSTNAYSPPVDEIVYLNEVGLPGTIVAAMIERGNFLREEAARTAAAAAVQAAALAAKNTPPPAPAPAPAPPPAPVAVPPAQPVAPAAPTTTVVVVTSAPPTTVVVQAPPTELPPTVVQFFEPLSPHGTWARVDDYGWCWQPTVVIGNPRWRPYADSGRWIYTDCGWYWQSDYSWGWAPFHYGRWLNHHRRGWVWVPDNVWSGAWVAWRSSPTHCGWAPLPPAARFQVGVGFYFGSSRAAFDCDFGLSSFHFTYLPVNRFCERSPHHYYVSAAQAPRIHNQTTVINNYTTVNNITVNGGIDTAHIRRAGGAEVRRYSVRSESVAGSIAKSERLVREGGDNVLYRPQLSAPPKPGVRRQEITTPTGTPATAAPSTPVASAVQTPAAPATANNRAKPFKPSSPVSSAPPAPAPPVFKQPVITPQPAGISAAQAPSYDRRKPFSPPLPAPAKPAPVAQPAPAHTPTPVVSAKPAAVPRPEPSPAKPAREYPRSQPEVKPPPAAPAHPQPATAPAPAPAPNRSPAKFQPQSAPSGGPSRNEPGSERNFKEARR